MSEVHADPAISEATTLRELNIHMGFMREKMNTNNEERKVDMAEIKGRLKELVEQTPNRSEFEELKKEVVEHKTIISSLVEFKDTLIGKIWGIGIMAGIVVSLITLIVSHYWK